MTGCWCVYCGKARVIPTNVAFSPCECGSTATTNVQPTEPVIRMELDRAYPTVPLNEARVASERDLFDDDLRKIVRLLDLSPREGACAVALVLQTGESYALSDIIAKLVGVIATLDQSRIDLTPYLDLAAPPEFEPDDCPHLGKPGICCGDLAACREP